METQLVTETSEFDFNEQLGRWSKRGYKPQGQLTTCPCKKYSRITGDYEDETRYSIVMIKE